LEESINKHKALEMFKEELKAKEKKLEEREERMKSLLGDSTKKGSGINIDLACCSCFCCSCCSCGDFCSNIAFLANFRSPQLIEYDIDIERRTRVRTEVIFTLVFNHDLNHFWVILI
jgi:hypothetical protein